MHDARMTTPKTLAAAAALVLLTACSTPPPPNSDAGRTPSSALETQKPAVKRIGDRVQVIQMATRPQTPEAKQGIVMLDVMCPVDALGVLTGGCSISDGSGLHRMGVITGFYPLISAEGGEGYRCLFDDASPKDELTAMVFCKAPLPKPKKRRKPSFDEGAPATEGAATSTTAPAPPTAAETPKVE